MKKVGNHKSFSKIFFSLALTLTISLTAFSQDVAKGKEIFNANCAACHKLDAKATGPALRGVAGKYDKEWLYKWIKNSGELIKSGDALAIKVFEENNKVAMTAFPQLSNEDIDNILAYTSEPAPAPVEVAPAAGAQTATNESGISNNIILGALSLVMLMLVVMLFLVNNMLTKIAGAKGVEIVKKNRSLMGLFNAFAKNQFLVLVSAILFLLVSAYFAYGYLMQIGVDQGYEPVQPIHYSHRIHAGENGIDCKYCHSAARVSKHSNIPSLNVCMNCHKNISEVAETTATEEYSKAFYDEQIAKLYDAVGWDKSLQKYTGKTKPVKWVRIHNLPDHVYFNHSQHVTVAGVECQTCHGPVEEMEIMKQHAPLTMGWCINCHKERKIDVENNPYYEKLHAKIKEEKDNKSSTYSKYFTKDGKIDISPAQNGALECSKCHY
jgi:mono/diheme cytochrome c family protein